VTATINFAPKAAVGAIPLKDVLSWAILAGLICLLGISIIKGMYAHEFVHDSRHLLGFPCH
jgi:cobalt transporter subunit CbtB